MLQSEQIELIIFYRMKRLNEKYVIEGKDTIKENYKVKR